MKETHFYSIAGHKVKINYDYVPRPAAISAPSFQPFLIDEKNDIEGDPVLSITVDTESRPDFSKLSNHKHFPTQGAFFDTYDDENGDFLFEYGTEPGKVASYIAMSKDFKKAHIMIVPKSRAFIQAFSMASMAAYTFAVSDLSTVTIHSSVVKYKGKAYMFLGKSGTGKSTHSQSWLRNFKDTELLNDDNPAIRIFGDKVIAYGTPWSGKTPCYKQDHAEIGALVKLEQAKVNQIKKLDTIHSFTHLFMSVSTLINNRKAYDNILTTIIRITELVPVYELKNLPDDAAAKLCESTIVAK